jgi:hypothetical protein
MSLIRSSAEAVGVFEKGWSIKIGHFGILAITLKVVGTFKNLLE